MGISNKRWNPVRILRRRGCKEDKGPAPGALTSENSCCEVGESQRDDLNSRVSEWLNASKLPEHATLHSEYMTGGFYSEISELGPTESKARKCVIYHPDFADWSSVKNVDIGADSNSSSSRKLKMIDDASASLSSFLRVSFNL